MVVLLVIGGFRVISEKFTEYLKMILADLSTERCLEITMLTSERIE